MTVHFTIESDEGLPIRGDLEIPETPRALLVMAHGFKGFKDWGFFPWLSERLARAGIAVCRFNMSRSGIGEDPESFDRLDLFADDTYSTQIADLKLVTQFAQKRFPTVSTFLLGHSRGGGVALLAADEIAHLEGVITWSAISSADRWDEETKRRWRADGHLDIENARTKQMMRMSPAILDDFDARRDRLDILAAAGRLRVPLLALHGGRDESVPVDEVQRIGERVDDATVAIIGNASHTYNAIHPLVHVPFELSLAAELTAHFVLAYA